MLTRSTITVNPSFVRELANAIASCRLEKVSTTGSLSGPSYQVFNIVLESMGCVVILLYTVYHTAYALTSRDLFLCMMVNTRIIVCLFVLRKGIILLLVDYFKSSYHCYRLP